MVESGERLDEYVSAFVAELIAAGRKHVERFVEVEVEVAVEVSAHKLVYLVLGQGVQVLELVQGGELLDVETVWRDHLCFALEEVFGFVTYQRTEKVSVYNFYTKTIS